MDFHLEFSAPAQRWIDAGLAVRTEKGKAANLADIAFAEAQANKLLHLTGRGALALDRKAKNQPPPSPS